MAKRIIHPERFVTILGENDIKMQIRRLLQRKAIKKYSPKININFEGVLLVKVLFLRRNCFVLVENLRRTYN